MSLLTYYCGCRPLWLSICLYLLYPSFLYLGIKLGLLLECNRMNRLEDLSDKIFSMSQEDKLIILEAYQRKGFRKLLGGLR